MLLSRKLKLIDELGHDEQTEADCDHEFEGEGLSNCCSATIYPDSDICSDCKEHCEEDRCCVHCGENEYDINKQLKKNRRTK